MSRIDVKALIKKTDLDKKLVAKQLFPGNGHPVLALNRFINQKSLLNEQQMSKLAALAGLPDVSALFDQRTWKRKSKNGKHTFESEKWFAELDTNTWETRIFDNNSMFHETILHAKSIGLETWFAEVEKHILTYQNK